MPNTLRAGFYNVSVECFSQGNQLLFRNFTQDVGLITDVFEIYASTDKPIYKAGETGKNGFFHKSFTRESLKMQFVTLSSSYTNSWF